MQVPGPDLDQGKKTSRGKRGGRDLHILNDSLVVLTGRRDLVTMLMVW